MALNIRNGQTVLFIGDSITDCGRRGPERPLGNGYVKLFCDFCVAREPGRQFRILNRGIGGDKVTGLRDRWDDDVLRHEPDWLSVKIGINDLSSFINNREDAVSPEQYREAYDDILARTRRALPKCRLLLVEPFFISTDRSGDTRRRDILALLPRYLETVRAMHRKYRTRLVQTHALFQNILKHHDPDFFYGDPVHPNLAGHVVIAEAVYRVLSR